MASKKVRRKMENGIVFYALQMVSGLLFAVGAFVMKMSFSKIECNTKRINQLEVDMARNTSENETLFKRLDGIEQKLDRLLENWRSRSG